MLIYSLKRFGFILLTLFIIVTITFFMMHSIPGDPLAGDANKLPASVRENYYKKYGLDKPITSQYVVFLGNLLHGNLGESLRQPGRTVMDKLRTGLPASMQIGWQAIFIGVLLGCTLGVTAALRRGRTTDRAVMILALIGISTPSFVMAFLLQFVFAVNLKWFPISGFNGFNASILPTFAFAFGSIAAYSRYMRASCLEIVGQDYMLTAKAKGISNFAVTVKHLLRNAVLPVITSLPVQFLMVIFGSLTIESIFNIPGLGGAFLGAITAQDYPLILGFTIIISVLYLISLLIVDILYGVVDPRIRVAKKKA
ncbi:MAG: ABC transporter permease [Oscillospiraceae bacterium]|nr:ABC transporter permease [Oscillospiraceae bacterium]